MSLFGISVFGSDLNTLEGVREEVMNQLYYGTKSGAIELLKHRNNFKRNEEEYESYSREMEDLVRSESTVFNRRKLMRMKSNMELVVIGLSDEEVEKIKEYQGIESHEIESN